MPNLNYEEDTRHVVSDKVIRNIEKTSYAQDDFGVEKYGTPLHHSLKYDWLQMGFEEVVDLLKYLQCEKDRKEYVIGMLQAACRQDDVINIKEYIQVVLEVMGTEGTGK